jgi:hypothetical protein
MTDYEISWPPTVADLKVDMGIQADDIRKDDQLSIDLGAAFDFAAERKQGKYRFDLTDPDQLQMPEPDRDFRLGILRLAARWNERRRTKDGTVQMQELGIGRVASSDADIDRMLRLGRFNGVGVFA